MLVARAVGSRQILDREPEAPVANGADDTAALAAVLAPMFFARPKPSMPLPADDSVYRPNLLTST